MSLFDFSKLEAVTMRDLLLHELQDLLNAERQLVDALPKMAEAATNPKLRKAFSDHLEETKMHALRLEDCFHLLNEPVKDHTCDAMTGLVKEGQHVIEGNLRDSVKDAALISSAQRVEHYEIAGYGTAAAFARIAGSPEVVELLEKTLKEEKHADSLLNSIAATVNDRVPAGVA